MLELAITKDQASRVAEAEVTRLIQQSSQLSGYQFQPLRLQSETERFWVFSAGSDQLQAEGFVPGAVRVSVDKEDGHVWSEQELERFYQAA
jgi:hypothetical protein